MAALLIVFLLANLRQMHRKIIRAGPNLKIRPWLYIRQAWMFVLHFATQKQFSKCERPNRSFWAMHGLLMSGYVIMFALIVFLLPWFQIDVEGVNWTTWLGYYATVALLVGCVYFAVGRMRRTKAIHKDSHFSDWMFLGLLAVTVITGIATHVLRYYLQWPLSTYAMYVVHLAVVLPMFLIEVPFGKWAHLLYRPFAIYFASVRIAAREEALRAAPEADAVRQAA
jgi:heterodisulfide reductase subunit C/quinone-modifying oxidoreductase subunit QmoC